MQNLVGDLSQKIDLLKMIHSFILYSGKTLMVTIEYVGRWRSYNEFYTLKGFDMAHQHYDINMFKYSLSSTLYSGDVLYNQIFVIDWLSKGSIPLSITLSHTKIFVLVKDRTW